MNTELIQLKGVVKKFKKNLVLDGINLSIPEGKITGIIGASGEGKSTILKLIIGFYRPTRGEVLYLKRNVYEDFKNIRKRFGFSTEDGSFYENLTVTENLHHFGRLYKLRSDEIRDRTNELLKFVGLDKAKKTKAKNLSVGMKKRLDIACSIIHDPEVLIMDEPTADLDPLLRKQILTLIKNIRNGGTTIVITTQLLEEMDEICDKIAILCNKKIVEEGDPIEIRGKYNAPNLDVVFEKIFMKVEKTKEKDKKEEELKKLQEELKKAKSALPKKDEVQLPAPIKKEEKPQAGPPKKENKSEEKLEEIIKPKEAENEKLS